MKRPDTLVDRLRRLGPVDAVSAAEAIDAPFIDYLVAEFGIPDRDALVAAIETAAYAYAGAVSLRPDRRWDELHAATQQVLGLIREMRPAITDRLARHSEFGERAPERLDELIKTLSVVGPTGRWFRSQDQKKSGRKPHDALRSMLGTLANYWVYQLGRPRFTQNQVWPKGEGGREEPATEATRFAYAVIEFLAPGQGKGIKSLAKEFTWIRPL